MKKAIFVFVLFFSFSAFAQDVKDDIKKQFSDYTSLIIKKDFGKALDKYGNEDFLKIFPKDKLVPMMEQVFNAPEMEFKIFDPENIEVSDKIVLNGKTYYKIHYMQKMHMKFKNETLDAETVLPHLQSEFGLENVKYNDKTGFFEIAAYKDVIANLAGENNYKFTVVEKKQIFLLKQILPEELLKDLK